MKKKIWKIAYSILLVSSMITIYFLHHYINGQPNKVTEIQQPSEKKNHKPLKHPPPYSW